jgi:ribosomal protein L9
MSLTYEKGYDRNYLTEKSLRASANKESLYF